MCVDVLYWCVCCQVAVYLKHRWRQHHWGRLGKRGLRCYPCVCRRHRRRLTTDRNIRTTLRVWVHTDIIITTRWISRLRHKQQFCVFPVSLRTSLLYCEVLKREDDIYWCHIKSVSPQRESLIVSQDGWDDGIHEQMWKGQKSSPSDRRLCNWSDLYPIINKHSLAHSPSPSLCDTMNLHPKIFIFHIMKHIFLMFHKPSFKDIGDWISEYSSV